MPMPYRDSGWYESVFGGLERRISFQTKEGKMTRLEASVRSRFAGPKSRAKPYSWVVHVGSWMGPELHHERGLVDSQSAGKIKANLAIRRVVRKLAMPFGRR